MNFDQHLTKVVVALCDALGTEKSGLVKQLVLSGKWSELVATTVHPSDYSDATSYHKDAIATELLRKCAGLPTGIDLHANAVKTFWASEQDCLRTNSRMRRYLSWFSEGFYGDLADSKLYDFVNQVRSIIRDVLGPLPKDLVPRFGKGATYHDRGTLITIPHKLSSRPTRTRNCWWADIFMHRTSWGFANLITNPLESAPRIVSGNRFTSVPKDSSKNRGICIEPSVNLAFQLCIGAHLKERLMKRAGIDLKNGQAVHTELARDASKYGHLATIDLSNASDTISRNVVKLFLPSGWFDLLDDLRSPTTLMDDGRVVRLEKFSSMGNGFTFELETLIFYAISRAICPHGLVKVYGDDIIVPVGSAVDVLAALSFFGFTPNKKKTFIEGPFRESCGGDFFDGQAVRPYHLEEIPHAPHQWISLANGLRRLGVTDNVFSAWRFGLRRPWFLTLDAIPSDLRRIRGPRSYGDSLIHDTPSNWSVRVYGKNQYRQWVRIWVPVTRSIPLRRFHPEIQLAAALYGVPSSGPTPRGQTLGHRKRWVPLLEATEF